MSFDNRPRTDYNTEGIRFHILIEIGGNRQHLLHDHASLNAAMSNIEGAALDELEVLNDTVLSHLEDAIMTPYIAKRVGDNCIEIIEKKTKRVITRYTVFPCAMNKGHDGRPRWSYRGYMINTNSKKNRFCVNDTTGERLTVRSSLNPALACIDDLCAGITPEGLMTNGKSV